MFAVIFFKYAPILGELENKFLSTPAMICLVLMLLLHLRTGNSLFSNTSLFLMIFFGFSFYHGLGDLEMYRLLPIFVILAAIRLQKLTAFHTTIVILNFMYFTVFITQRNVLDSFS